MVDCFLDRVPVLSGKLLAGLGHTELKIMPIQLSSRTHVPSPGPVAGLKQPLTICCSTGPEADGEDLKAGECH